ncbi:MAG: hypothetical protein ACD_51C00201G0006 [uncultured bacterium]|nr:MAG: hypothetical protein ACD_51C00201G0006 [uncultured bacterium]
MPHAFSLLPSASPLLRILPLMLGMLPVLFAEFRLQLKSRLVLSFIISSNVITCVALLAIPSAECTFSSSHKIKIN